MPTTRRGRGEGSLYKRASDGLWVATVELGSKPDGTRLRKTMTGKSKRAVLEKLQAAQATVSQGRTLPTRSTTVERWLEYWMEHICRPRVAPRTHDGYRIPVRYINDVVGRIRLDRLTASHVRLVQTRAGEGRSPSTALKTHVVLRKALKDAVREGLLTTNVADLVDPPRKATVDITPLTVSQARQLLDFVVDDPLRSRWMLAVAYGMRQGECLGLTWNRIDFHGQRIDVAWQLQRLPWQHGCVVANVSPECGFKAAQCPERTLRIRTGYEHRLLEGAWVLTRPKAQSQRVIPLVPFIAEALLARRDLTHDWENPHGLVFGRENGMPFDPAIDGRAWHELLRASALPNIRLHDARHTAATVLLDLGVDVTVIQAILGHSDAVTTRTYQHVNVELAARAMGRLEAALVAGEPVAADRGGPSDTSLDPKIVAELQADPVFMAAYNAKLAGR